MSKKSIPTIHQQMIYVGFAVMIVSMFMYFFAPPGKAEAFIAVMTTAMGFLFGKFTNGFRGKDDIRDVERREADRTPEE